ncbi:hypothetical protein H3V53_18410 [Paraburkholderia bengalensis]|uniref:Uncharacterized protein n=1 Tax=Paraburkholderia bengalensis TaxID=2747562 RepID=A0ABU8IUD3_9BURK
MVDIENLEIHGAASVVGVPVENQCRGIRAAKKRGETLDEKKPARLERAESISGGDMEETGTTIHATLMRRNNFLRENPNFFSGPICPDI